MKPNRWPDFLFTVAVRFVSGVVLGGLACVVVAYRGMLHAFSLDDVSGPLFWLAVCGLGGGLVATLTTPHWQAPWYKGIRGREDNDD